MDLMSIRRGLMMQKNGLPAIISFLPIQSGSGDATPTNVRPITAPLTLTGIGEIYGGVFDTVARTVTESWGKRLFQNFETRQYYATPFPRVYVGQWITGKSWEKANGERNVMSDVFHLKDYGAPFAQNCMIGVSNTYGVYFADDTFTTKDDLAIKYASHYVVYELRNPTTYNLTDAQYAEAVAQLRNHS